MAQTMTASLKPMTDGQIETLVDRFRSALRKHRRSISSDAAQYVLGIENLGTQLFAKVGEHAQKIANMLSRSVTVDLSRSRQQVIDATGRVKSTAPAAVDTMPKGKAHEQLFFFKPRPEAYHKGLISDEALEQEYNFVSLKPASPYSLAKLNEDYPAFADTHPNGTHWKDVDGDWCYAAFLERSAERQVYVYGNGGDWGGEWWFAGVRKS